MSWPSFTRSSTRLLPLDMLNLIRLRVRFSAIPLDTDDAMILGGIAVVSIGVGLIFLPAGLIVAGLASMSLGLFRARWG